MNDQKSEARRERLAASYKSDISVQNTGKGYSRIIRSLRIILPLLALGIIAVLFVVADKEQPALPVQQIETPLLTKANMPAIERNELVAPEFASETKSGRKYRVMAATAVQELRQPDLIIMASPRGELQMEDKPIIISAKDGTYNQKTQFMTLNQSVQIMQEGVGEIILKTLEADLTREEMHSPHPVVAQGTYGTLNAQSLKITDQGMTIVLSGPVTLRLEEGYETWFE